MSPKGNHLDFTDHITWEVCYVLNITNSKGKVDYVEQTLLWTLRAALLGFQSLRSPRFMYSQSLGSAAHILA